MNEDDFIQWALKIMLIVSIGNLIFLTLAAIQIIQGNRHWAWIFVFLPLTIISWGEWYRTKRLVNGE